ncbi:histidine phosphatase family protein [Granulosicoccus antarcticus]|uniref:Phosphoserine phosphatase 1 n=1 Tax=Granulosicoccus antarcticus IMCC3135 TaxID=1192854 RepID=A0A2Z2P4T5_9GAMM|nr:histidine phosphatase family protein [Granulosicoccus antarcticus]ASJ74844.1 Phosphoserine phosphatase 1 [Granulosicoccus antarcticus IMCC3135]
MRLHIVRHGQTHWNAVRRIQGQLESELNDNGKQQARDRGADIADLHLSAVYSSSSVRTRQTTALILGERNDFVTFRDDLREVRLGIWQGRMWADVEKAHPKLVEAHRVASPSFEVEGAENSYEVQKRGVRAIESIISAHTGAPDDANILIVSHGAIMKTILAHYSNVALGTLHTLPELPNCAHCIITVDRHLRSVEQIASTPFNETSWTQAAKQPSLTTVDMNNVPRA